MNGLRRRDRIYGLKYEHDHFRACFPSTSATLLTGLRDMLVLSRSSLLVSTPPRPTRSVIQQWNTLISQSVIQKWTTLISHVSIIRLHFAAHRDWYSIAEQRVPAPHLAHPERRAALRIVLVTVPRFSRSR